MGMSLKLGNGKEWEQLGSGNLRENRGNGESFCEIAAVVTGTETALNGVVMVLPRGNGYTVYTVKFRTHIVSLEPQLIDGDGVGSGQQCNVKSAGSGGGDWEQNGMCMGRCWE